jgi:hypothetical protein
MRSELPLLGEKPVASRVMVKLGPVPPVWDIVQKRPLNGMAEVVNVPVVILRSRFRVVRVRRERMNGLV